MYRSAGCGQKISLPPYIIGLVVFGGKIKREGIAMHLLLCFTKKIWEVVGAVPPTHARLKSPKVCPEVGVAGPENEIQITMAEMKEANTTACNLLIIQGSDRNTIQAHSKKD